jgi:large subunit ribosomal protein L25
MAKYPVLTVSSRVAAGTSAAHKLRLQHFIPASVCGHGESQSLAIDTKHFLAMEHAGHTAAQIISLKIDGKDGGLAIVREIQRHPVQRFPIHVDMQRVSLTESVEMPVPVTLIGEPIGVQRGGMLEVVLHAVTVRGMASAVPLGIEYDISALEIGDMLHASQLPLPDGCVLADRPEELIAAIRAPRLEVVEAEAPEAEAAAAPAEATPAE